MQIICSFISIQFLFIFGAVLVVSVNPAGKVTSPLSQSAPLSANSSISCTIPDTGKVRMDFKKNSYTGRGLDELMSTMLPVFDFMSYNSTLVHGDNITVHEIGCGSGRTLMEVQSTLLTARLSCTNREGYGMQQSNSQLDLIHVAKHYNIAIKCNSRGVVYVPQMKLDHGIQQWSHDFPCSDDSVDIVYSQHALNQGKLHPYESAMILPKIVPMLKPGGFASLMLLFNVFSDLLH